MSDASVHIKFDINGNIYKDNEIVGITGANLTGILLFTFLESDLYATPDFVKKGEAILEYSRLTDTETLETGFIPLGTVRHEDTGEQFGFAIEIKSSLLKYKGNLNLQLHITNQVDGSEEIEVYKSKIFNLYVAESINATKEIPEDYPNWIDEINVRLQEMDNLDIKAERVSNGVEVISTSKTGVESIYLVHDGEKGEQGERGLRGFKGDKGEDGKDGYVQYSAGNNITIENNVISASGGIPTFDIYIDKDTRYMNGFSTTFYSDSEVVQNLQTFIDNLSTTDSIIRVCFKDYNMSDIGLVYCISSSQPNTNMQEYLQKHLSLSYVSNMIDQYISVDNKGLAFKVYVVLNLDSTTKKISTITINTHNSTYLPITNTNNSAVINFTPTQNYHPATKKYVDDNIDAKAIGSNQLVFARSFEDIDNSAISKLFGSGTNDTTICNWFSDVFTTMYKNKTAVNQCGATMILTFPGTVKNGLSIIFQMLSGSPRFSFNGFSITSGIVSIIGYYLEPNITINDNVVTVNKITITTNERLRVNTPISDNDIANKKYIDDKPKSYTGYDATKTQTLKNINGVLTWVSDTESGA